MWLRLLFASLLVIGFAFAWEKLDRIPIKVVGHPSVTGEIQRLEQDFFENLATNTGLPLDVSYTPIDQLGFKGSYELRMIKGGALDLVSLSFLQNATDEPTLLGVDLMGDSIDFATARSIMETYAPTLDRRLQEHFNAKLLGIWPFGPQVFFCRTAINSLRDLDGLKIRVGNESFSSLISHFSATPVVMPFEDVRELLRNGVVDCAISSAASGNAAGWPQYATHFFRLGLHFGLNGYVINLKLWNRLSSDQQSRLERVFREHADAIWASSEQRHADFSACNVGGFCNRGTPYRLIDVEPTQEDYRMLREAFEKTTFKDWAERCDRLHPGCAQDWKLRVAPVRQMGQRSDQ